VLAHVIETIAKTDFSALCKQSIFAPLAMNETAWFLKDLDATHIAMPYHPNDAGVLEAQGMYGFLDYPSGQLRTSARQLGRFLAADSRKGELDGKRILGAATVDQMLTEQVPASITSGQSVIWYFDDYSGVRAIGHNGAYYGVSTDMWLDLATGAGFVLLTNGGPYMLEGPATTELAAMTAMDVKLMALARALP
jgi:CubicO group peptidase (beta-lactamase class C family)